MCTFPHGMAVAPIFVDPDGRRPMDNHPSVNEGFDRLQRLLLAMRAGDDLRAADAAVVTGLNDAICLAVLEGLERAGLMARAEDDRFVRRTLDLMPS
jgi:hypothetical protein